MAQRNPGSRLGWLVFGAVLTCALAGSLLEAVGDSVREVFAWSTVTAAVIAASVLPLRFAASWVVSSLMVQEWLSRSSGLAEGKIAGVNASTIITAAGLLAYVFRYGGSKLQSSSIRGLKWWLGLYVLVDLSVALRGYRFEMAQLGPFFSGYMRLWCIYLWTRRVALREDGPTIRRVSYSFFVGPALVGYSTFSAVIGTRVSDLEELSRARTAGLYDPNLTMTGLGLVVLLAMFTSASRGRVTRLGPVAYTLAGAGVMAIAYSGSRTALAALTASFVVGGLAIGGRRMIVPAILGGVLAFFLWQSLPDALQERFADAGGGYTATRIPVLANAYAGFLESPVAGGGRDTYRFREGATTSQVAHNTLLGLLAEGGLIQAALYVGTMVVLILTAVRMLRRKSDAYAALALSLVVLWGVAGNGLSFTLGDYCSGVFLACVTMALCLAERNEKDAARQANGIQAAQTTIRAS